MLLGALSLRQDAHRSPESAETDPWRPGGAARSRRLRCGRGARSRRTHLDPTAIRTDAPVLVAFVDELRRHERFQAFARAPPSRACVSEPLMLLVLAALHAELGRALLVLLPEDADARDAAEGSSWYAGSDRVALLPSRGVSPSTPARAPPHLNGGGTAPSRCSLRAGWSAHP